MSLVPKTRRVNLVATSRQLAAWRALADQQGLSLSAWLRSAADTVALDEAVEADRFDPEKFRAGA
jgi:hypothetical protein